MSDLSPDLQRLLDPLGYLRSRIDFTPYQIKPDAPHWLEWLTEVAINDLGVLALLGPKGISVINEKNERIRPRLDPPGLFLAGLVNCIRGLGRKVAVGIPPAGRHLPLLLASSVVLADTLRRVNQSQGVLVLSPDLDLRSRYLDLYVKDVPLDEAHPGSRMQPTGNRVLLRSYGCPTVNPGVCFFLPQLSLPQSIRFQPAVYLLDLRYAKWVKRVSDLTAWLSKIHGRSGILALYTIGDGDTLGVLTKAGFFDLPMDHVALSTSLKYLKLPFITNGFSFSPWQVTNAPSYLARKHEVKHIAGSEVTEKLISTIGGLIDEQKDQNNFDLNRSRWLLAVLAQMPVPLIFYEQAASILGRSTLKRLISQIGIRSRHDTGVGAIMQTLRMLFDQLYVNLEARNPRADSLRVLLSSIGPTLSQENVLILVRDKVVERALQTWLGVEAFPDCQWLRNVDVRGCAGYIDVSGECYDLAIVNGAFPRRYRWIGGAALGKIVYFIAYQYEVEVITRQLENFYGIETCRERARKREQTIHLLLGKQSRHTSDLNLDCPKLSINLPPRISTQAEQPIRRSSFKSFKEAAASLLEAAQSVVRQTKAAEHNVKPSAWQEDRSEEELAVDDIISVNDTEPTPDDLPCIQVEVTSKRFGHGMICLGTEQTIELMRPTVPGDMLRLTPPQLLPGDVLLRMEESGRTNLFDQFVALAEGQPEMSYLAKFRRYWQDAIHRIVATHRAGSSIDYCRLLQSLRNNGATIESEMALRFWVQDLVIGPETAESIRAVGYVSGSEILIRQAKEFDHAFRRIRGIRQGIGRRISGAIRRSFGHLAEGAIEQPPGQLDDRLGVPLDELIESIDFAEVISISKTGKRVAPHWLGRFHHLE